MQFTIVSVVLAIAGLAAASPAPQTIGGSCNPGSVTCSPSNGQTYPDIYVCSASGAWELQAVCPDGTSCMYDSNAAWCGTY